MAHLTSREIMALIAIDSTGTGIGDDVRALIRQHVDVLRRTASEPPRETRIDMDHPRDIMSSEVQESAKLISMACEDQARGLPHGNADALYYIAIRPYGLPWLICRIPAAAALAGISREVRARGWVIAGEQSEDGTDIAIRPLRFHGLVTGQDMKSCALKLCDVIAAATGYDVGKVAYRLSTADIALS